MSFSSHQPTPPPDPLCEQSGKFESFHFQLLGFSALELYSEDEVAEGRLHVPYCTGLSSDHWLSIYPDPRSFLGVIGVSRCFINRATDLKWEPRPGPELDLGIAAGVS